MNHIALSLIAVALVFLTSCSEPTTVQQVQSYTKRSDVIWLCDVDTASATVRFRAKQPLKTNGAIPQFTPGQLLSVSGPPVQPGHQYGDEALVFLSRSRGSRLSADFILALHDGRTGDGTTRDAILKLIHDQQGR